jgi:Restriction Endonuclease associating with ARP
VSSRSRIVEQQKAWALGAGLRVIAPGYLESVEANLRLPMAPRTLAAFQAEEAAELKDFPRYPAKLRALFSSAALVVNVFEHWAGRDAGPLLSALGITGSAQRIDFEARFPISPDGTPPNVDVCIALADGRSIGIESKFTEWHVPRRPAKIRFKDKYFPDGAKLWTSRGLPGCQALAEELQDGRTRYRFFYATQLLKHALGMATQCSGGIGIYYLYYDWSGPAAREHRREIERFAGRVGTELGFQALSYQELFARLRQSVPPVEADYLAYLQARYFGG